MSAMTCPVSSKSTWATNRLSPLPGRDRRVPADDGDAGIGRLLDGGFDLVAGVVGDHDRVDALGDGVGDELDLSGAVGARSGPDELGLADAELGRRLDRALVGLVEHGDARALREQDAGEVATTTAADRLRCRRRPWRRVPRSRRGRLLRGGRRFCARLGGRARLRGWRLIGRVRLSGVVVVAAACGGRRARARWPVPARAWTVSSCGSPFGLWLFDAIA